MAFAFQLCFSAKKLPAYFMRVIVEVTPQSKRTVWESDDNKKRAYAVV